MCTFEKVFMDLLPPNLSDKYFSLDSLFKAINIFAFSQGCVVIKRRTKVSKKGISRKTVLTFEQSKEYIQKLEKQIIDLMLLLF